MPDVLIEFSHVSLGQNVEQSMLLQGRDQTIRKQRHEIEELKKVQSSIPALSSPSGMFGADESKMAELRKLNDQWV